MSCLLKNGESQRSPSPLACYALDAQELERERLGRGMQGQMWALELEIDIEVVGESRIAWAMGA